MKVMVVVGTRPEVIKMAPVVARLQEQVETVVCATGQHQEMLTQALHTFHLVPHYRLNAMQPGQSLNRLASRLMGDIDQVLDQEKPDWVLVQGDTTTALCGALAAFHKQVPVGHVEAGLRTGKLDSPFPEEANRLMIARIATRHFAPTRTAAENLLAEGIEKSRVVVTGNTVVDAIALATLQWKEGRPPHLPEAIQKAVSDKPVVLVTCHRRENFGEVMEGICHMLKRLCSRYRQFQWIFPVHFNPQVREPVRRILGHVDNISLIDPVDYHTNLYLMSKSTLVVSDSGGIQEETPTFFTPIVVMREHTERAEGIAAGFATLAGQEAAGIEQAVSLWLDSPERLASLKQVSNPYGDGKAALRIVNSLCGREVDVFHG